MFAVHTPPSVSSGVVGRPPAQTGARGSKPGGGGTWEGDAETEADGVAEVIGDGGAAGSIDDATGLGGAAVDEGAVVGGGRSVGVAEGGEGEAHATTVARRRAIQLPGGFAGRMAIASRARGPRI